MTQYNNLQSSFLDKFNQTGRMSSHIFENQLKNCGGQSLFQCNQFEMNQKTLKRQSIQADSDKPLKKAAVGSLPSECKVDHFTFDNAITQDSQDL